MSGNQEKTMKINYIKKQSYHLKIISFLIFICLKMKSNITLQPLSVG